MATLGTMFKKIYGEALAPYGFKKIKGKQPYFVRVIGDEIVHVITYATRPKRRDGYKEFSVYGGVASVYRSCINLDITPPWNFEWLNSSLEFYSDDDSNEEKESMFDKWYTFSYKENDDESLVESIKYSLEVTQQVMLPILEEVVDVKTCVEFYQRFFSPMLRIYADADYGQSKNCGQYNEGLLNFKVYDVDSFIDCKKVRHKKTSDRWIHLMKIGKTGLTEESYAEMINDLKGDMEEQIDIFKFRMQDTLEYNRVLSELKARKHFNLDILRKYGIDI